MKTATIPSLRVDPELRQAAEDVLHDGESLSGFVEQAIRQSIIERKAQQEFISRGLLARDRAARTGHYVDSSAVVERLRRMLDAAKSGRSTK